MLYTTSKQWRRSVLALSRFLQRKSDKNVSRFTVSTDKANEIKHHNKAMEEVRSVKDKYFLERRSMF